ncbi:MAG: hypothetical protein GYA33_13160 [Thermogutta sp.]|nr:hypothetical protein [Thermogutta sp.]
MTGSRPPERSFAAAAETAEYRPLSGLAVSALIVGAFSPLAFFSPFLWFIPALASILGVWAELSIRRQDPPRLGLTAARIGAALGLFLLSAAPARWFTHRALVDAEARRFGQTWLELVRSGDLLRAHQLSMAAPLRQPLDDRLPERYAVGQPARRDLEAFLGRAETQALIALGKRGDGRIRFFDTERIYRDNTSDVVVQSYAVTYHDEQGKEKTFFIVMGMTRLPIAEARASDWYVSYVRSDVAPSALEDRKSVWEEARRQARRNHDGEGPQPPPDAG